MAFSLAESLVTLALVLALLGVVAEILKTCSDVSKFSSQKDQALLAVEIALDRVTSELSESISVSNPPIGTSALYPDLTFAKIDPNSTTRLPTPLPVPLPATWNPAAPADRVQVHYYLNGQTLMRQVTLPGGVVVPATTVADGLQSFLCRYSPAADGSLQIQVTVQEQAQLATFEGQVLPYAR